MSRHRPLADYLRPETLDDIIGQQHLIGPGAPLRRMAEKSAFVSSILWGPPGSGKTTLARAMAKDAKATFASLNATSATVNDVRKVLRDAEIAGMNERKTIIWIDEIGRFSKAQQDVLLPGIEDGTVILFGATTEKPKFAVNSTILSRTMIWEVKSLSDSEMVMVLKRVLKFYKLNNKILTIQPDAAKLLINRSSGDCRKLITAMETIIEVLLDGSAEIVIEHIDAVIPEKHIVFDKTGNEHYDLASAMQSSVQNSDADAAIYWLAKWLESGEDPSYIARRILIMAFEDAGDNSLAILSATAATFAAERTGYPECMIPMAHAVIAAAQSGRAKIAYKAIKAAVNDVRSKATVYVPSELRAGAHGEYVSPINRRYVLGDLVANGRLDDE